MKKTNVAFLTVVLAMLLAGCGGGHRPSSSSVSSETTASESSETSSSENSESSSESESSESESESSSSSSEAVKEYTVTFTVNGTVVQTSTVEEGQTASYTGATPVKEADADAVKYRFKGWDKDINAPITGDTNFTAVFAAYAAELMVDDFEQYAATADLIDAGWKALGYHNDTQKWDDQTAAAVSLGTKSVEGQKALRFDSFENGVGYKFAKTLQEGAFNKSANALKFRLMAPSINTVKVILNAKVEIAEELQAPSFSYTFKPTSGEYVDYVIPLDADGWALWGDATKSIKKVADWSGVHQDDLVNYLTEVQFYLQGSDGANGLPYIAFLDSMRFVTLDAPEYSEVETMGQYTRYTGTLADGHILRIDLGANATATARVIDLETPLEIQGSVAVNNKEIIFTSADSGATLVYKGKLVNGGQKIEFVQADGALKNNVADVNLDAVQVVDNYDQYTEDGKAYYQGNTDKSQRSGARGAYYSEYYTGSGNADFGGNGWNLMGGSGDQLKLKQDGGRSGNNYLCMKNSASFAMRYMQWGLIDGTSEQNNFRGSKLSFWVKTNGKVPAMKVSMYSQTTPRNATKDQYVKAETFTNNAAISEWTHFEVTLNPNVVYYGFCIFMEKNNASDAFLYIDDVEVYGANPYAKFESPVVPSVELVPGNAYLGKVNGLINATLKIKSATEVSLIANGLGMTLDGTYSIDGDEFTMVVGGATYKATISEDLDKLTFVSVDGSNQVAGALNGLSFDLIRGENVESYSETGRTIKKDDEDESKNTGSSGAFYIDMYKGGSTSSPVGGTGWELTGSGAGAALNKEDAAEGSQSLKLLNSQWGNMRYIQWDLYKGTAKPMTGLSKFSVYLKNFSADVTQKVKIMAYKVQKVDSSNQGAGYRTEIEVTLPAGQDWTEYTVELDATKTYYGFALLLNTKGSSAGKDYYVGVDAACFYNIDNNPSLNFYGKKDLELNGTTLAGAATIKFGEAGAVYLTCAAAGFDNVAGKYTMAMGEAGQVMVVTIGENTMTGIYAVNAATGEVTFTVTEATGQFSALVAADTVFSNK